MKSLRDAGEMADKDRVKHGQGAKRVVQMWPLGPDSVCHDACIRDCMLVSPCKTTMGTQNYKPWFEQQEMIIQ